MRRFVFTVSIGAVLLFLVQPMAARALLPWFGGSAAVWTTCQLFFQLLLLAGYAWTHGLVARLSPRAAEIFTLRYFEGLGNQEIARLVGSSQGVVAVLLHRTRYRLRKEITSLMGEAS